MSTETAALSPFEFNSLLSTLPPSLSSPSVSRSSSAATSALAIPEILLRIFSNFSSCPISARFLAPFARVNSLWRGTAESMLYGNLHISWRFSKFDLLTRCLEVNPALYGLVHSCKIVEFRHYDLREELGDKEDWGEFLKSKGYDWDEPGWTEADRQRMLDSTSGIRRDKEWDLARAHVDNNWLEGRGPHLSFAALLNFLGRLVNLRRLDLEFVGTDFTSVDLNTFALSSQKSNLLQVLKGMTHLTMMCENSSFGQPFLHSATNLSSLSLNNEASTIPLPSLPHLRHLLMDFFADEPPRSVPFTIGNSNDSLETIFICPGRRPRFTHDGSALPQLSHLHFQVYDDRVPNPDVALSLLPVSPQLIYLAITCRALPTGSPLLNQIVPILPAEIRRIVVTVEYGWRQSWLPDLISTFVQSVLERNLVKLREIEVILPEVEYDSEVLVLEARSRGVNLSVITGSSPQGSREEEYERMMVDWRASKVGFRG